VASEAPLAPGQRVRVVSVDGLELNVVPETAAAHPEPAAG
jgi:membrane protein implicated in regulation of membrane protease activity